MTTALPPQATAFHRMQQLMTPSPVPSISTELLTTADGELNRELNDFLFDPPSDPALLRGKRIAICCTNGVEEVEITGSLRWLTEHGATVHVVSPRIGEFHPTLGLRFPPLCATHVLAIRLMENAGWLKIDRYLDQASVADYDAPASRRLLEPRCPARRSAGAGICPRDVGSRQTDLRDLSRPMGDGERRDPQGAAGDRGLEHPSRPRECGRDGARRALRGRRQLDHRALSLRPAADDSARWSEQLAVAR